MSGSVDTHRTLYAAAHRVSRALCAGLDVRFRTAASAGHVVRDRDVVVTAMPSIIIGSDTTEKTEPEPAVPTRADPVVTDRTTQRTHTGDLRHAISAGLEVPAVELWVLAREEGETRPSEETVTVRDLTGTEVQDTVIANNAYAAAKKAGLGREFHA